ncbi:hypothetical protein OIU74_019869 [Salix koriyanagi]|uniref:Uncharacterized protein n=1 Tax=Salix koriyanagi TaxID=2511006 RepID=A0A9Q0P4J5_9ROSI|nr:hypothetical protein OIU74_019869 [Salix koriyanagi]
MANVEARVERLEAKMFFLQKGMRVACALFLVTLAYAIVFCKFTSSQADMLLCYSYASYLCLARWRNDQLPSTAGEPLVACMMKFLVPNLLQKFEGFVDLLVASLGNKQVDLFYTFEGCS